MRTVPYSNTLETLAWMDEDNEAPETINIAIAKSMKHRMSIYSSLFGLLQLSNVWHIGTKAEN